MPAVREVERAADSFLTGETYTSLVFFRAGGADQSFVVPAFSSFWSFLGWIMRQTYTRTIMPTVSQPEMNHSSFISMLASAVQTALLEGVLHTRTLNILAPVQEYVIIFAPNDLVEAVLYSPSARDTSFTLSAGLDTLEDLGSTDNDLKLQHHLELAEIENFSSASNEEDNVDLVSLTVQESVNTAPLDAARTRGRARRAETPKVESQVRRSNRLNNNDGILYALPNLPTRRRASSVPRATPPEVLQISEMQRLGTEHCMIDPVELSEDRLLQQRKD